jgi:hypothetical protein
MAVCTPNTAHKAGWITISIVITIAKPDPIRDVRALVAKPVVANATTVTSAHTSVIAVVVITIPDTAITMA